MLGGDFFVLTDLDQFGFSNFSAAPTSWAAWQWANATKDNGAAVFLRRSLASATLTVALNYVDPLATYELSHHENYAQSKTERCSGAKLAKLGVSIPVNSSLLLEYRRVPN